MALETPDRLAHRDVSPLGSPRPRRRDGRTAAQRIASLKRSEDPQRRLAGHALAPYLDDPRAEGAFYIRFHAMPPCHAEALRRLWSLDDEWRLFRRICRFFAL